MGDTSLWGEHGKGLRSQYVPDYFGELYPCVIHRVSSVGQSIVSPLPSTGFNASWYPPHGRTVWRLLIVSPFTEYIRGKSWHQYINIRSIGQNFSIISFSSYRGLGISMTRSRWLWEIIYTHYLKKNMMSSCNHHAHCLTAHHILMLRWMLNAV
ncbi:hypothetical protein FQZ97_862990 [compost metagenome]